MIRNQEMPIVELADRRWEVLAVAVFLMALKSVASALLVVVDDPGTRYLEWFEAAMTILAVAVVLWQVFVKFTRVPADQRGRFLSLEGYVASTAKMAMVKSWGATFILLTLLTTFAKRWLSSTPSEFFLHVAIAVMLGVFSLSFFIMNRSIEDEGGAGA